MTQIVGLTSLEGLRLHVLRDATDERDDDKLIVYGEMMSERVTDFCAREFFPSPADDEGEPIERLFYYNGEGLLDLMPYELRSVDGITLKADPDGTEQAITAYSLNPRGGTRQGTYLSIDMPPTRLISRGGWTVAVTGHWGMADVPKQVELAVWIAVDDVMKNPGGYATQQLGGYQIAADQFPSSMFDTRGELPRASIRALGRLPRRRRTGSMSIARAPL